MIYKIFKMSNNVESIIDLDCFSADEAVELASHYYNRLHPSDKKKLDYFYVWQFDDFDFYEDGYSIENRGSIVYSFV